MHNVTTMQIGSKGMKPKVSMIEDKRGSTSTTASRQPRETGSILKSKKKKKSNLKRFSVDSDFDDISSLLDQPQLQLEATKKTPLELDLEIQTERVLYILDSTIRKLKTAAHIFKFIQNDGYFLRKHFQSNEVEFILNSCAVYSRVNPHRCEVTTHSAICTVIDKISMNKFGRENRIRKKSVVERKKSMAEGKDDKFDKRRPSAMPGPVTVTAPLDAPHSDAHIAVAVEMICTNKAIRAYIENNSDEFPDETIWLLVETMQRVRTLASERLSISAEEERQKDIKLRKAWQENQEYQEEIEKLTDLLEKQKEELGAQYRAKEILKEAYEDKIEDLNMTFREDVRKVIQISEKNMTQEAEASDIRQAELKEDADHVERMYKLLLEDHLTQEKLLRVKKFKIETQLASWLAKYDADIGERQAEFEEISSNYEEEKREMEALQDKFDEQEDEYDTLMEEKEQVERKIYEEKAYIFLMNRSARRIQRYWRAYKERKLARKRARRGKGKQKSGDKKKGKGKGSAEKKKEVTLTKYIDPNAALEKQFKGGVLEDLKGPGFAKEEVTVDLSENKG